MKKSGIKLMAKVLVCALTIGCFAGLAGNTAGAAKLKMSKKSLKMKKGDETVISVKGAKKKVKWSSTNKKIVKLTKVGNTKVIVKAKKEGNCTIIAKVGKKNVTCSVTVSKKNTGSTGNNTGNNTSNNTPAASAEPVGTQLSNSELAAKMAVKVQPVVKSGTVLFTVTNGNSSLIDTYKVSYQLTSVAGGVITSDTVGGYAISAGATQYIVVSVGKDKAKLVDPNTSTVSVTVSNNTYSHYYDASSEMSVTLGQGSDPGKVPVTFVNSGAVKNYVRGAAIFTDISGNIVLAKEIYTSVDAGATKFEDISIPYEEDDVTGTYLKDETGNWYRVKYADAKVYFNAYRF